MATLPSISEDEEQYEESSQPPSAPPGDVAAKPDIPRIVVTGSSSDEDSAAGEGGITEDEIGEGQESEKDEFDGIINERSLETLAGEAEDKNGDDNRADPETTSVTRGRNEDADGTAEDVFGALNGPFEDQDEGREECASPGPQPSEQDTNCSNRNVRSSDLSSAASDMSQINGDAWSPETDAGSLSAAEGVSRSGVVDADVGVSSPVEDGDVTVEDVGPVGEDLSQPDDTEGTVGRLQCAPSDSAEDGVGDRTPSDVDGSPVRARPGDRVGEDDDADLDQRLTEPRPDQADKSVDPLDSKDSPPRDRLDGTHAMESNGTVNADQSKDGVSDEGLTSKVIEPKVTYYIEQVRGEWVTSGHDATNSLLVFKSSIVEQDSYNKASIYPGYRKLHPTKRVVPPSEWHRYCKHRVLPPGGWEELLRSRGFLDVVNGQSTTPPSEQTSSITDTTADPPVDEGGKGCDRNDEGQVYDNTGVGSPQPDTELYSEHHTHNTDSTLATTDHRNDRLELGDRPTIVINKRLGSLSKEPKKDKDAKDENEAKPEAAPSVEELTLTKQVIIHRDERGYGLTVSGDNPVFVRSVKENGAAAKAGIQVGDRILKVNGTLVTKFNHKEVVKLIKSGSYVALTLLGRSSGQQMASTPTQSGGAAPHTPSVSSQLPPPYPSHDSPPVSAVTPPGGTRAADRTSGHSAGARVDERTAISGPTAVDAQTDKELKMRKISMIRFMYEEAYKECQELAEELKASSGSASAQIQSKLDEKRRVCERLGDQLYLLTGIPTESHISSPKSPPSGLPPPGGTFVSPPGSHRPPLKRYSSGDGLNNIQENKENISMTDSNAAPNPAPWLPGGPKHRKAESMPESVLSDDFSLDGIKEVTVSRSNSDSDKRSKYVMPDDMKESTNTASADEIEKLRTSSLPSNVYETSNNADSTSPSREAWEESVDTSYSSEPQESTNAARGSGRSTSPPRDMSGRTLQVVSPLQADIIPMEEEEEVNIEDDHAVKNNRHSWSGFLRDLHPPAHTIQSEDHGPFSDLNRLKHKPAHLAVFLHYLISNSDPSPLLFYLVTENYPHGSIKELRRWAYEIYSTFLVPTAVIKVEDIDSALLESIEQTLLNHSDKEDVMRTIFQNARHMAQKQISELLADFRQKRTLGLANLYGDNELSDNMDRAAELKTVENKLLKHLTAFTKDPDKATPRDKAMASALATIMKQLGVNVPKTSTILERCPTFISKDKKIFKLGGRSIKKNGHQFIPTHYHSTTYCNYCRNILWGIGYQGFQCSNCDVNVHKACIDQMPDHCTGRRKKEKRTSMLNMLRKTTNPNTAAIKEAQRIHDESSHVITSQPTSGHVTPPGPTSGVFQIRSGPKDEEEEDLEALRAGNKVSSLVEQYSQLQHGAEDAKSPTTPPRGRSPEAMDMDDQNDLQVDDQTLKSLNQSGSSSNSSLSNRSLDSPSTSAEVLSDAHHMASNLSVLQEDSDIDVEPELPPLEATIPKDLLKKLRKSEKKRQDVINELFYTERTHVRDLKIMQKLFCYPMMNLFNDKELVQTLFPGLDDLIEVHRKLNNKFKNARKESPVVPKVAELLLSSWEGEEGEEFKKSCATFCRDQSHALAYLRMRQRKDPKLANFLQEAQSNPLCRRLELKDLIPQAMQRLTKYPLFIETLLKHTPGMSEEHILLQKALECAREILEHVNQAVKDRENEHKLADFQRRLDIRVFDKYQNFDLCQYKLIHDGLLTWRITKQKQIQMHVLLLNELLVLLQKQDDRLILKYHSTARDDNNKSTHSPIINLNNLMVRPVATDKYSMFLISDGEFGPQIYELQSRSTEAIKRWFKYLSEGTSDNRQKKQKDATSNLPTRPVSMVVPDPSSHMEGDGSTDQNKTDNKSQSNLYSKPSKSQSLDSLEKLDHVEVHSVVEPPLAHPSDVTAKSIVVNIAPPVQSPHERLKEKDKIIDSALQEKRIIIAKMYGVPIDEFTNISEMAAEAKTDSEKDVQEIILASIHQAEQLTCLVSSSLSPENAKAEAVRPAQSPNTREQDSEVELSPSRDNIKDSDGSSTQDKVHRSGTLTDYEAEPQHGEAGPPKVDQKSDEDGNGGKDVKGTVVTSGAKSDSKDVYVSLPSGKLLAITSKLNAQLHHLMEAMAANEKEQERLQDQLKAAQEQVASLLGSQKSAGDSMSPTSRPNSYISITSSTSEAGETLEEHETNVESPSLVSSISESSRTCTDDSSRVAQDDMPSDTKVCTLEYILGGNTDGDNQLECRDTVCEPEKETKQVEEVGKPEEHTESKPVAEENTEVKQAESDQEQQTANKSHQNKAEVSDERNSDEEDVDEDFVDAEDGTNEGSSEAVPKEVTTSTEDEAEPRISSTETSDSVEPTSMKTNGDDAPSAVTPDSSEIHCELMDKSDLRPPEDSQTVPPVDEKSAGVTTETTDEENN